MNVSLEKKMVAIILGLFVLSQFIIFGSLFFAGILRFEISTPEASKIFDVTTVLEDRSRTVMDSLAMQNRLSLQALAQREIEIAERERTLTEKQERLEILSKEIEERKKTIERTRKDVERIFLQTDKLAERKEDARDAELKRLARIYANMQPAEAANILQNLDNKMAVDILTRMPAENAGRIMENLKTTAKGVAITNAAMKEFQNLRQ